MPNTVIRLFRALVGLPIDGVALINSNTRAVRIDFKPTATDIEKVMADSIVAAFDWRDRRPRPESIIRVDLAALTAAQIRTLVQALPSQLGGSVRLLRRLLQIGGLSAAEKRELALDLLAYALREHPDFARNAGIPIDGDEPV